MQPILKSLKPIADSERYIFEHQNICDAEAVKSLFDTHQPDAVMHLAAESHVDRSIDGPGDFIQTNIVGTFTLLNAARGYWDGLESDKREAFRFVNISTDEVYGSLGADGLFTETTAYSPIPPTPLPKPLPITWRGPGIILTDCR